MNFYLQRIKILTKILFMLFAILIARCFLIQIINGNELGSGALAQQIKTIPLDTGRGDILDSNGKKINEPSYLPSVAVFPAVVTDKQNIVKLLSEGSGIPQDFINKRMESNLPFKIPLKRKKEADIKGQGLIPVYDKLRYGDNPIAVHTLGYLCASNTGYIGCSGVEKVFDNYLSGTPTGISVFVDAKLVPVAGYTQNDNSVKRLPYNVQLTINRDIQAIVENVMDHRIKKGAVVVMSPTGKILAMASRPSYNPNFIEESISETDAPLINRSVRSYSPGSIFKIVVAAAALEERKVSLLDLFNCNGQIYFAGRSVHCHTKSTGGHGLLTFKDGFINSCNPVFIMTGQKLGKDMLIHYASLFGLGASTGIGLSEERSGNLPDESTLVKQDLANISIGQGPLDITPLQAAAMMTPIINNGIYYKPRLFERVITHDGITVKKYYTEPGKRVISSKTAFWMKFLLNQAVKEGTGKTAGLMESLGGSAGKTGSAETGRIKNNGEPEINAWFVGYFPISTPEYIISVIVEDGLSGSSDAAPVFKEIAEQIALSNLH